jgi:hypothetical protein
MSAEGFEAPLVIVQRVEVPPQPVVQDVPAAPIQTESATPEQARAVDQVFSQSEEKRVPVVDFVTMAAAGMLLRDLVEDTLAAPTEDEEDEPVEERKEKE